MCRQLRPAPRTLTGRPWVGGARSHGRSLGFLGLLWAAMLVATPALAGFSEAASVAANAFSTDTLDPPSSLSAEDSGSAIDLSWTATPDAYAHGYDILRSETSGSGYAVVGSVSGVGTTSYTDDLVTGPQCAVNPGFSASESRVRSSSSTSVSVDVPSGTQADDVLIAHVSTDGSSPGFSTPAGWTLVGTNTSGLGVGHAVYYRVATGGEPASYTFSWSVSEDAVGVISRFVGVDVSGSPVDVSATSHGSDASPLAPSVTPSVSGALVVRLMSSDDNESVSFPSGHTGRYGLSTDGGGGDVTAGLADVVHGSGATGTAAFGIPSSESWTTTTLALVPDLTATARCVATFEGSTSTTENSSTTSTTLTVPAGTQDDDILLVHIAAGSGGVSFNTPTGWTLLDSGSGGGAANSSAAVWYRVADGTEPASYAFTRGTSEKSVGVMLRYSGADPTAPIHDWTVATGESSSPTAGAVSAGNDVTVVRFVGTDDDETITSPSGHTARHAERTDGGGSDTSGAAAEVYVASAGTTAAASFSIPSSESWRTHSIALQPANPVEGSGYVGSESRVRSSSSTSVSVDVPSGTQADDVLIAHVSTDGSSPGFSTPAGWTLVGTNTSGLGVGHAVYYRVATGGEPASYTFSWSVSEDAVGVISRFVGVDVSGSPVDVSATSHGSDASPLAPSVTPSVSGALVVRLMSSDDNESVSFPSGHTGRYGLSTDGGGGDVTAGLADVVHGSGATGTAAFGIPSSESWTTTTLALPLIPEPTYHYVVRASYQNWTSANSGEAVPAPPSYTELVSANSDLVGYWRLGASTTLSDAPDSHGSNDGTPVGGVTVGQAGALSGDADTSVSLNGSTGTISLGNPTALQLTSGTVEAWIRTSGAGTGYRSIVAKPGAYNLSVFGNAIGIYDDLSDTWFTSGVAINDGSWHHVAITFQSGVTNGTVVYVDGTVVLTGTATATGQAAGVWIGSWNNGSEFWAGWIDEVAIYDAVLAPSTIAAHHAAGLAS